MKRTAFLIVLFFLLHPGITFSQYRGNTWVFGDSSGVAFLPSNFVININSSINSTENSSSISTEGGGLLFYVGGYTGNASINGQYSSNIWNKNHTVMPNGGNIMGGSSSTHGSLIIPSVSDSNHYYIFCISDSNIVTDKVYYSIVDITLDAGFGDVIQKNILLLDTLVAEKMCAVRHGNGRDWWLLTHGYGDNVFYKYLISNTGINGPFLQAVGDSIYSTYGDLGQMIFSPDGNKLVMADAGGQLNLFKFDRCTGLIFDFVQLDSFKNNATYSYYYGCSFSPNSDILYASYVSDSLFQYDLTMPNIVGSKLFLFPFNVPPTYYQFGKHLLGPDNKIYIATPNAPDSITDYLTVINNPNSIGLSCNLNEYGFYLNGKNAYADLPTMPNYNLGRLVGSPCDTLTGIKEITTENSITLYPNPSKDKVNVNSRQQINYYQLTTATGALLQEKKIKPQTNFELNLKQLSSGVYFLKLQSDKSLVVVKVLKE